MRMGKHSVDIYPGQRPSQIKPTEVRTLNHVFSTQAIRLSGRWDVDSGLDDHLRQRLAHCHGLAEEKGERRQWILPLLPVALQPPHSGLRLTDCIHEQRNQGG